MVNYSDRFLSFAFGQGDFEPHDKGLYFVNTKSDFLADLSGVKLLSSTIDTVRQLYKLTPCFNFIGQIDELYELAIDSSQYMELHGYEFSVGHGGQSGYKYRLQNNELGVIIFFKNRRVGIDACGSHLKIEFSPHYLLHNTPEEVQNFSDAIATWVSGDSFEYAGVAPHLALDVQGWEPDETFINRLTMRSRRVHVYDGIEKADFTLSEAAVTYGDRQTITVGSVKSVQMSVYDKTTEAKKSDKMHYMESVWRGESNDFSMSAYDPEENVRRIEFRFHHSVIRQFEKGSDVELSSYLALYEHLGALWQYGMGVIRLDHEKDVLDPYWQLFTEDADFHWSHENKTYKRAYKKPGIGNEKNVTLALGNWLSLIARTNMRPQKAWTCLKKSGMYDDVLGYYKSKGLTKSMIYEMLREALKDRRLIGKAA